jgi:AAA15 family ATPase/GTPase
MYKEITLECLRGIKDLTIDEFGLVNVFVGKINCGKTTLYLFSSFL